MAHINEAPACPTAPTAGNWDTTVSRGIDINSDTYDAAAAFEKFRKQSLLNIHYAHYHVPDDFAILDAVEAQVNAPLSSGKLPDLNDMLNMKKALTFVIHTGADIVRECVDGFPAEFNRFLNRQQYIDRSNYLFKIATVDKINELVPHQSKEAQTKLKRQEEQLYQEYQERRRQMDGEFTIQRRENQEKYIRNLEQLQLQPHERTQRDLQQQQLQRNLVQQHEQQLEQLDKQYTSEQEKIQKQQEAIQQPTTFNFPKPKDFDKRHVRILKQQYFVIQLTKEEFYPNPQVETCCWNRPMNPTGSVTGKHYTFKVEHLGLRCIGLEVDLSMNPISLHILCWNDHRLDGHSIPVLCPLAFDRCMSQLQERALVPEAELDDDVYDLLRSKLRIQQKKCIEYMCKQILQNPIKIPTHTMPPPEKQVTRENIEATIQRSQLLVEARLKYIAAQEAHIPDVRLHFGI